MRVQSSSSDRNQSHLSESGVYLQLQQFWQLSIQPVQWDGAARHCDTQDRDQGSSRGATRTLCLSDNKLVKIVRSHFTSGAGSSPHLSCGCPLMKVKIFSGPRQNKSALKNSFFIVSFYKTIYLIVRTINLNYVFLF